MKLQRLSAGGLIPTYCCSSACAHCLYGCHQRRDHDYIDRPMADRCFSTVARLGCRVMHIGGGEPFLRPEGLYEVLESAQDAGIHVEYVETNSSWFTSRSRVDGILKEIRQRGVNTLLLSISPFHNEFIPLRKVLDLGRACEENGIGVFPWTTEMLLDVQRLDPSVAHSLDEYREKFGDDYVPDAMSRYGVVPGGTALETLDPYLLRRELGAVLEMQSPCARMLGTTHFHVDLYGNYVPCLCPGLSVRLEDLDGPLDSDGYPLLNSLVRNGVRGLYELAHRQFGFEPDAAGYPHPCALCTAIRRYLAVEKRIDSHELKPVEFYEGRA